jgi:hypothetical protein
LAAWAGLLRLARESNALTVSFSEAADMFRRAWLARYQERVAEWRPELPPAAFRFSFPSERRERLKLTLIRARRLVPRAVRRSVKRLLHLP